MRAKAVLLSLVLLGSSGCGLISWLLPEGYGPGYELDTGLIGTGEQAIVPRSDASYIDGEPLDYREF